MVDIDRFRLLLDYSLDGKSSVNAADLIMICKLYLETDNENIVKELDSECKNMLKAVELSKDDLIKKLSNSADPLTILVTRLGATIKNGASDTSDQEQPTKAILRGKMSVVESKVVWQGNWSTSAENYKKGDKFRFKYKFLSSFNQEGDSIVPESGDIEGSFMIGNTSSKGGLIKVKDTKFKLIFEKDEKNSSLLNVSGKGENQFGQFEVQGKLNTAENKLVLERTYKDKTLFDTESEAEDDDEFIEDAAFSADDEEDDLDEAGGTQEELAALLQDATTPLEDIKKNLAAGGTPTSVSNSSGVKRKANEDTEENKRKKDDTQ